MSNNASHYARHDAGADGDLAAQSGKRFAAIDLSGSDVSFAGLARVNATNLLRLNVSYCDAVDDRAVGVIGQFALLEELDLSGSRSFTDAALADLRGLPRLAKLSLDFCAQLGDGALTPLAALPSLRAISLFSCDGMTPAGLRALAACSGLRELTLPGFGSVDAPLLDALSGLSLEVVSMTREPLSDDVIRILGRFRTLRELVIAPPAGAGDFSAATLDTLRRALPRADVRVA